jgi:hypothetical protein
MAAKTKTGGNAENDEILAETLQLDSKEGFDLRQVLCIAELSEKLYPICKQAPNSLS